MLTLLSRYNTRWLDFTVHGYFRHFFFSRRLTDITSQTADIYTHKHIIMILEYFKQYIHKV